MRFFYACHHNLFKVLTFFYVKRIFFLLEGNFRNYGTNQERKNVYPFIRPREYKIEFPHQFILVNSNIFLLSLHVVHAFQFSYLVLHTHSQVETKRTLDRNTRFEQYLSRTHKYIYISSQTVAIFELENVVVGS